VHTAAPLPPVIHGILLGTAAVWAVGEIQQSLRHRSGTERAGWGSEIIFRLGIGATALLAIAAFRLVPAAGTGAVTATAWSGLGLLWCGVALRFWSFVTLGRYFTVTVQTAADQPVITGGPYRVIRHPSYTGILLAVAGVGLITRNWLALAVIITGVTGCLVFRIRVEERALLGSTGDSYRSYAAGRKRLIPFVW
jgi:protein-S-isoprenylcysteine O-methyltransferase Ste14